MSEKEQLSKAEITSNGEFKRDYEADFKQLSAEYRKLIEKISALSETNKLQGKWIDEARAELKISEKLRIGQQKIICTEREAKEEAIRRLEDMETIVNNSENTNYRIIKSLEAKEAKQEDTIKDYNQNLLVMKQQIERILG